MGVRPFTVFLVYEDGSFLYRLSRLLQGRGYDVRTYVSARQFLAEHDSSTPGCAIIDVVLPDCSGLEFQRRLSLRDMPCPVIFLSEDADIETAVTAMKAGAVDFLTKQIREDYLIAAIENARRLDCERREAHEEHLRLHGLLARLSPRERQVLALILEGRLNKQIAADLGISEKTIEVHRGRVMAKLGISRVTDLVRFAEQVGIGCGCATGADAVGLAPNLADKRSINKIRANAAAIARARRIESQEG